MGSVKTHWLSTRLDGPSGDYLCKKPRPLRIYRGTCFQWVQSKRTGCPQAWMDLLAAIFVRNRGPVMGTCFCTFRQKVYTKPSWIERPTAARARHPSGPVFTLSAQKSVLLQWLPVFHAFLRKKVSHVGKNDRNVVSVPAELWEYNSRRRFQIKKKAYGKK